MCGPCPAHSRAPYRGSTECRCDLGFYRAAKDARWTPCTQPPSAPQNVTANFVDPLTVILSWVEPKFLGGRNDTIYRIDCDICGPSVSYVPQQEFLNETKVAVTGLSPQTNYRFLVYAENGASGHDSSQFTDISVKTQAISPSETSLLTTRPSVKLTTKSSSDQHHQTGTRASSDYSKKLLYKTTGGGGQGAMAGSSNNNHNNNGMLIFMHILIITFPLFIIFIEWLL